MKFRNLLFASLAIVLCPCLLRAQVQQIVLEAGWNLVSVQVGESWTCEQIATSIDEENVLQSIWGYDATSGKWCAYLPQTPAFTSDLHEIVPGRGYWVKVRESCVLNLDGVLWEGESAISPGWNLVGFPGMGTSDLTSLFGSQFVNVQQVWSFEDGANQCFTGYDISGVPVKKDLTVIESGKGYWVYASKSFSLLSVPEIMLTADVDMPPLQTQVKYKGSYALYAGRSVKYAGDEDASVDLNGNGIVDDAWTQDTIFFDVGVVRQPIVIGNEGSGAMNWSVDENCSWLEIEGTSSGTVAGKKAYVYLVANRTGLAAGSYSDDSVVITAGGVSKSVKVQMKVATVAGDFKGYASTTKVNGKEIALGKVDMGLNMFMSSDDPNETRFKAVIDNENSLLFPRDVFMNGVFYVGSSFSLTTSFSMPGGDRNAPPYDTFSHVDPALDQEGVGDKDWNTNGVLDVENPFPFAIRRSVTLLGQRTDENTLEGSYLETIAGALPNDEKICVEGSFSLARQSYEPTRRSIYNEKNDEVSLIGQSKKTSIQRIISLADAVQVNKVKVSLNVEFPSPESLTITLASPAGTVVSIHNRSSSLITTAEYSDFDGENGKGDWILDVSWLADSGERGWFYSFGLDVGGIASYSVSGRLVDENGDPLAGASVSLSGSNEIGSQITDENGNFTLSGLTENDYGLVVSMPGYQGATSSFLIDADNVSLGVITNMSWGKLGLEGIVATPKVGYAPLDVQFVAGHTPTNDTAIAAVNWTIEREDAYGHVVTSKFTSAVKPRMNFWSTVQTFGEDVYVYKASVTIRTDDGAETIYTCGPVALAHAGTASSSDPDHPLALTLSNCGFIGAGAGISEYEQTKRDCAAFDINRAPTNSFSYVQEDTDFFVQENTPFYKYKAEREPLDSYYDEYEQPDSGANRFRIICTMGGCVFGTTPAQAGGFALQSDRIEE